MFDTALACMALAVYRADMRNTLTLSIGDRYDNVPGATECWVDGFDDGQNGPSSPSRNNECTDKGNQYYEGFMHGCKDVGNTEYVCVSSTD